MTLFKFFAPKKDVLKFLKEMQRVRDIVRSVKEKDYEIATRNEPSKSSAEGRRNQSR